MKVSWTPEHLFEASVNSYFMTTFLVIAENSKLEFVSFSADAKGKLEKLADKGMQWKAVPKSRTHVAHSGKTRCPC